MNIAICMNSDIKKWNNKGEKNETANRIVKHTMVYAISSLRKFLEELLVKFGSSAPRASSISPSVGRPSAAAMTVTAKRACEIETPRNNISWKKQ